MISLSHSRLLATTDGRSYLIRPLSLCSWSMNVVAWLMTLLSVCRVLVPKELLGKQYHSCLSNAQWPLRIWRRLEIGGRSPCSSMQCYIPLFLQALWYKTQQVYKKSSSHKKKKNGELRCHFVSFFRCRISSVGRALDFRAGGHGFNSRGRTNTQGLKLRREGTAFTLRTVRPSRGSDDNVKWRSRLQ